MCWILCGTAQNKNTMHILYLSRSRISSRTISLIKTKNSYSYTLLLISHTYAHTLIHNTCTHTHTHTHTPGKMGTATQVAWAGTEEHTIALQLREISNCCVTFTVKVQSQPWWQPASQVNPILCFLLSSELSEIAPVN